MDVTAYYLELMFISLKIIYLLKLMKKGHTDRDLIVEKTNKKKQQELIVNLWELILAKKIMMQIYYN